MSDNQQISELEITTTRSRWRTRRLMAWLAFLSAILSFAYGLGFIKPDDLSNYESLYSSFFIFSGSIVASYIGFATWDDVSNGQQSRLSLANLAPSIRKKNKSVENEEDNEEDNEDSTGGSKG